MPNPFLPGICLGRLPFHAEGVLGLYEAIRSAPLEQPAEAAASAPLRALLAALLAKDSAGRLSLAAMAAHPWVTQAGATPLAIPLVRPAPQHRMWFTHESTQSALTLCRGCLLHAKCLWLRLLS